MWQDWRQGRFWVIGVGGVMGCGYDLVGVTAALNWAQEERRDESSLLPTTSTCKAIRMWVFILMNKRSPCGISFGVSGLTKTISPHRPAPAAEFPNSSNRTQIFHLSRRFEMQKLKVSICGDGRRLWVAST